MQLVIGKLQKRLVRKFTTIEAVAFTIWGLLTNASWYFLIIYGATPLTILTFIALQAVAYVQLFDFLLREHTIATDTGNAGPEV